MKSEQEFSKNVFGGKSLYEEKPDAKTKEQEEEEKKLAFKNRIIPDDAEYKKALKALQWFIKPFLKFVDKIGCCKSEKRRISTKDDSKQKT